MIWVLSLALAACVLATTAASAQAPAIRLTKGSATIEDDKRV